MIKRMSIALVLLCAALAFSACSHMPEAVPETLLEWEVEDFEKLGLDNYGLGDYDKTKTAFIHNPDKASHTDAVQIDVSRQYTHGVVKYNNTLTYQYDKSKDLWELIRKDDWRLTSSKVNEMDLSLDAWKKTMESNLELAKSGGEIASQENIEMGDIGKDASEEQRELINLILNAWEAGLYTSEYDERFIVYGFEAEDGDKAQRLYWLLINNNFEPYYRHYIQQYDNAVISVLGKDGFVAILITYENCGCAIELGYINARFAYKVITDMGIPVPEIYFNKDYLYK